MRQFYLRTDLDPDEHIRIISAPKQDVKGTKAYGSDASSSIYPAKMTITSVT